MTGRLLTTTEVAERLRAPIATLRYWRSIGTGPRGCKIGKRVLYRECDVDAWVEEQMQAQNPSQVA